MRKTWLTIRMMCCLAALPYTGLHAATLVGEGIGEEALLPAWRTKDPADAAKVAMKEHDPQLASAGLSQFLRLSKKPASDTTVATLVSCAERPGMLNRTALTLAFQGSLSTTERRALLEALTASPNPAAQKLAAATLATMYCHRYISDPAHYASARNDQKIAAEATADPSGSDLDETGSKKKSKGKARNKGKAGGAGQRPPIGAALFAASDDDTATLALVAAAFSGDARYRDAIADAKVSNGVRAGALVLYLARQEEGLAADQAARLFRAAAGTRTAPTPFAKEPFDPLLPGLGLGCMGLAATGDPAHLPLLVQALGSSDVRVRSDAVRAIRKLGIDDAALVGMSRLIPSAEWPLLVELCAALGASPDRRVVPALILRLENETGRCQQDLVYALSAIAGEQQGQTAAEWKTWWLANKEGFAVDPAKSLEYRRTHLVQNTPVPAVGYFYGLTIYSDRLVYVVDTSRSMKGPRIDSLRQNLRESLDSLETSSKARGSRTPAVAFNIVDFGGDVVSMVGGELTSDFSKGRSRAETMPMTLGTRSFDALVRGMGIPGVDSIYFLTDGAPVWGQLQNWASIRRSMDLLQLYSPVAIWSVAFDPKMDNEKAMRGLSAESFGLYGAPEL